LIQNLQHVQGKDELDLERDPPPDLAVEVEITRRLIDRVGVYAAMGVPELWRDNGSKVHVDRLDTDGRYVECDRSPSFPTVPLEEINRLLEIGERADEVTWSRAVRAWAQENLR
jgi:hypothetical protein